IETVHDQAQAAQDEDPGLKAANLVSVQNFGYVDGVAHFARSISERTRRAPSTIAFILPNATSRGRYFKPQSGATTIRSALTCGSARRIRAATTSGVSISFFERSRTPRMICFPGIFPNTEQSRDDCAVSIEICRTRESA